MMKTTTNKTIIANVERLSKIIEKRKELDLEEKEIKAALKDIMGEFKTNVLSAGDFVMIISDRVRTDLDKEMVRSLLGDKYNDCLTKKDYQIFEIKKA